MVLHKWIGLTHLEYSFAAFAVVGVIQIALLRWVRRDAVSGGTLMCVATLAYAIRLHLTPVSIINSLVLFAWGLRIAVKGLPPEKKIDVIFGGDRPACEVAVNKSIWIWLLSAPTVYYATMDKIEEEPLTWVAAGTSACLLAFAYDALENARKGYYCRNPYAFSSALINWGLFLTRPSVQTLPFAALFFAILYFVPGGACCEEAVSREKIGLLPMESEAFVYRTRTSAYVPIPPQMVEMLPASARRVMTY